MMPSETNTCQLCKNEQSLIPIKQHFICSECLAEGNDWRLAQWESWFQKRISRYLHVCKKCLKTSDAEAIHQARVTGRKITSLLQFLNVPKHHPLVKEIKRIHSLLNPVREADVFLEAFEDRDGQVHQQLFKKVHKKRKKLQKKLQQNLPELVQKASRRSSAFAAEELSFYALSIDPDARILLFESQFNEKADQYQKTVDTYGKQAPESIKVLHKVRIQSKVLRYLYADLSSLAGQDFSKKEKQYKDIQTQFGEINDVKDWLDKLDRYKEKLDVSEKEIAAARKKWNNRLKALIDDVELMQAKTRAG
ncbi:CHAD domain-containing protein [Domibacillus robiginosus]|uniref:CHAD domain-containing protein n=1 Tax=Domibacillus robiginosus TaxID=1071054 RepID=UPI00067DCB91|nr:CHAD domain-containing protein [Domibacillus robiginosus]